MLTLPLSSPAATLENAGGKGANLARLTLLGQPVPPGFIITTRAYRLYTSANHLEEVIASSLTGVGAGDSGRLEEASVRIRAAFSQGQLTEEITRAVLEEYRRFGASPGWPAAVRSSATTEDLPDLSFAGQQDTFLNVVGEASLLKAVVDCWSSLWTARAIGYRLRNTIPDKQAALAVVVQEMVASEVCGVLFTANPLTGLLSESVIDATFGLGEALVSGKVDPDHYVADSSSGAITSQTLGAKQVSIRGTAGGGVETIQEDASTRQALSPQQVSQLVQAGQEIQKAFGAPQDIEWAFAGGKLFILQSRPITSLFPVPLISLDPLQVWFSFGAFQGVLTPLTPLGQETIQRVVLGMGKKLGARMNYEEQNVLVAAGERLWIKITDLIRHPVGNRLMIFFLGIGEPGTAQVLRPLIKDPRLGVGKGRLRLRTLGQILRFLLPPLLEMPGTVVQPEKARERFDNRLDAFLKTVQIPGGEDRYERLANFAAYMAERGPLHDALPFLLPAFMPLMATSMASLNLIGHLLPPEEDGTGGISIKSLEVTRGLPRNVTTEMDLGLWDTAQIIKADRDASEAFNYTEVPEITRRYLEGSLPPVAQAAVRQYLERYGMHGTGEIDLGQVRWREDPAPVLAALKSYQQIPDEAAPDLLFEKNAQAAVEAVERMAGEVRSMRLGRMREKLLRAAARRVRLLLGSRESPKFYAVRTLDIARRTLLNIGEEFAAAGTIQRREDLFFLHASELDALAHQQERDWQALIASRRLIFDREMLRRQVPRVLVSDGRTFYEGAGEETDTGNMITGSPVSPGVVEGVVHVVLDPRGAHLNPGEILVCPGTDPAWTPLFMAAGGLVMEVGGMMTHGSVVAREYGIPAVVGVRAATQRLSDGQRIRLDGTSGKIVIL